MDYHLTPHLVRLEERLAQGILRQVLFTGYPGTGKTSFAQYYAEKHFAQYLYFLCHPWMTDEDFFNALDVAAVAIGVQDKEQAWIHGILRLAAESSLVGPVVLCLDEVDKVSSKIDVLLLDFLQTGQVPLPDHRQMRAHQENLVVMLTSNGQRQLSEPLLRRLYRYAMEFLPPHVEADILRHRTGASMPLVKKVIQFASLLRSDDMASKPSLSEMELLLRCLTATGESDSKSIARDVEGTLLKSEEDRKVLDKVGNWPAMLHGLLEQDQRDKQRQRYVVTVR